MTKQLLVDGYTEPENVPPMPAVETEVARFESIEPGERVFSFLVNFVV
jgi:hypothetical protein